MVEERHVSFATKIAICETNPTSSFALSQPRRSVEMRNEPNIVLRIVTAAPKCRNAKRTQRRPPHCHFRNRGNELAKRHDSIGRRRVSCRRTARDSAVGVSVIRDRKRAWNSPVLALVQGLRQHGGPSEPENPIRLTRLETPFRIVLVNHLSADCGSRDLTAVVIFAPRTDTPRLVWHNSQQTAGSFAQFATALAGGSFHPWQQPMSRKA
jgi:hypothetical protein